MKGLILLVVLWLVGCNASLSVTPQVESVDDQAARLTETALAGSTPNLNGTALSVSRSHEVATITPISLPSGTRIEPLVTLSGRLIALGWSHNGEWFAYRDRSISYDYLYQPASGDMCLLAETPQLVMWENQF